MPLFDTSVHCPTCGENCVHFDGLVVRVNPADTYEVVEYGFPGKLERNAGDLGPVSPGPTVEGECRGGGFEVTYRCEAGHRWSIRQDFHKGMIYGNVESLEPGPKGIGPVDLGTNEVEAGPPEWTEAVMAGDVPPEVLLAKRLHDEAVDTLKGATREYLQIVDEDRTNTLKLHSLRLLRRPTPHLDALAFLQKAHQEVDAVKSLDRAIDELNRSASYLSRQVVAARQGDLSEAALAELEATDLRSSADESEETPS